MTPSELKQIVDTWGGAEKFAHLLGVTARTVYNWLNGTHKVSPPVAKLIRTLSTTPTKEKANGIHE